MALQSCSVALVWQTLATYALYINGTRVRTRQHEADVVIFALGSATQLQELGFPNELLVF